MSGSHCYLLLLKFPQSSLFSQPSAPSGAQPQKVLAVCRFGSPKAVHPLHGMGEGKANLSQ